MDERTIIYLDDAIDMAKRLLGDSEISRTMQTALHILPSALPVDKDTNVFCTDTISRQAAIDALMEFDKKLRKINWHQYPYTEHECRGVDEAIVKIANLPSAQPEIIRCKDCKYNATSKKCLNPNSFFLVPADDDYCSHAERRTDD